MFKVEPITAPVEQRLHVFFKMKKPLCAFRCHTRAFESWSVQLLTKIRETRNKVVAFFLRHHTLVGEL